MSLFVRQRVLSLMDCYQIFGEDGRECCTAKTEFEHAAQQLHLYDCGGNEIGSVLNGVRSGAGYVQTDGETFELMRSGSVIGTVRREQTLLHTHYRAEAGSWSMEGTGTDKIYEIRDGERTVARITKERAWGHDRFAVDCGRKEDETTVLLIALAMMFDPGKV